MKVLTQIELLKSELTKQIKLGKTIGFVPTMGFLHEGHLGLVRKARKDNHIVVVSIFVNPTQFGPNEDFDAYPRDIVRDETLLIEENVDYLFYPQKEVMYPEGFNSFITITGMTSRLCGSRRVGHFDGVALVVTKLFNIVQPTIAYFGLKDYQQFQIIKRLVTDLNINVTLVGVPIVREDDGLAMSSRNVFLKNEERQSALSLYKSFDMARKLKDEGKKPEEIIEAVTAFINSHSGANVDYVELVDPEKLLPVRSLINPFMCMLAVRVGSTRLIDNCLI